jgi:hypothetical protein
MLHIDYCIPIGKNDIVEEKEGAKVDQTISHKKSPWLLNFDYSFPSEPKFEVNQNCA